MKKYIAALDQGTTSSRTIIFDKNGNIVAKSMKEFPQCYPKPGWVEHDPVEIWETQKKVMIQAMDQLKIGADQVAGIGITNQRETAVLWEKETGKPVCNAVVWQCRRTAQMCDELKEKGYEEMIRKKTGLPIDPYFSGTKIRWMLDHTDGAAKKAEEGKLLFGTVETWLIWNLTGGRVHVTDYTNASRTMLYNINDLCWDKDILDLLEIPESILPDVVSCSEIYGYTDEDLLGGKVAIAGAAGDQQAALFGQTCFQAGEVKNTYGTGCFMLMNTGGMPVNSKNGLITTIACGREGKIDYALEGSIFVAGAAIQWLRDELGFFEKASESEAMAVSVPDTNGCYVVPAFTGLGAPYWDSYARGSILGLTRGVSKNHIVRATLESLAYQTLDVLKAMEEDSGIHLDSLKVDGGACANNFLMQFQADIIGEPVHRPECVETTATGAAYLAGLAVGYWKDKEEIKENWKLNRVFDPNMDDEVRKKKIFGWKKAVNRSLSWDKE